MKVRLVSSRSQKPVDHFECDDDQRKAKRKARKRSFSALVGQSPVTIFFQKFDELIQDWVEFGRIQGRL